MRWLTSILDAAGTAALTTAAWLTAGPPAGLAILGVALLAVSWNLTRHRPTRPARKT